MTAVFRCLRVECSCVYEGKPGPTMCPVCGSIWVKWVNFESFIGCGIGG